MKLQNKNILVISPEWWGANMLSKHHYAIELGRAGNKVYFLNPPGNNNETIATAFSNVHILNYRPLFRGVNKLLPKLGLAARWLMQWEIANLKKSLPRLDVVWSFDPYRFQYLHLFGTSLSIFHPVDLFDTQLDLICAAHATIVFSVSDAILQKYQATTTPKFFVNHGLSDVFIQQTSAPLKGHDQIRCGYVGNLLSNVLHRNNLLTIVKENPNVQFHFIGPRRKSNLGDYVDNEKFIDELAHYKNVHFTGELPPHEVASMIHSFDLFLLCYRSDQNKVSTSNSHKIMEYLSTGKPVVASHVSTYANRPGLLEMTARDSELPKLFQDCVIHLERLNTPEQQAKRRSYALNHNYARQLQRIERLIEENVSVPD